MTLMTHDDLAALADTLADRAENAFAGLLLGSVEREHAQAAIASLRALQARMDGDRAAEHWNAERARSRATRAVDQLETDGPDPYLNAPHRD